mgnify:CR=1 FL=1
MSDLKSVGIKCEKLKMGFAPKDVLLAFRMPCPLLVDLVKKFRKQWLQSVIGESPHLIASICGSYSHNINTSTVRPQEGIFIEASYGPQPESHVPRSFDF